MGVIHLDVEGSDSLGKLEVKFVDVHHNLVSLVQNRPMLCHQGTESVTLFAYLDASGVDFGHKRSRGH